MMIRQRISATLTHISTEQHGNMMILVKISICFAIQQPILATIEDVPTVTIFKGKLYTLLMNEQMINRGGLHP